MKTTLKLWDGRKVAIEQTTTGIIATVDGGEPKAITTSKYMELVMHGVPCGSIE
jgi:hypothetical protein